jgi:hypothetical protein
LIFRNKRCSQWKKLAPLSRGFSTADRVVNEVWVLIERKGKCVGSENLSGDELCCMRISLNNNTINGKSCRQPYDVEVADPRTLISWQQPGEVALTANPPSDNREKTGHILFRRN